MDYVVLFTIMRYFGGDNMSRVSSIQHKGKSITYLDFSNLSSYHISMKLYRKLRHLFIKIP